MRPAGRPFLVAAKDYVKRQPEFEKEATTQADSGALDVDAAALRAPRQTMTWDEVRERPAFTTYGGHTHNHVIVSRLDAQPLDDEIRTCRERIESETGTPIETFAYPNGRAIDFTDEAKCCSAERLPDGVHDHRRHQRNADTDWLAARRIAGGSSVGDLPGGWLACSASHRGLPRASERFAARDDAVSAPGGPARRSA